MNTVILDFDGTIADTRSLIVKTMQQTIAKLGLLARTDFKGNMSAYQQAKMQMELVNALIKSNKELLEEAMRLVSS